MKIIRYKILRVAYAKPFMDDLYQFFIDQAERLKKEKKFEEAIQFIDEAQKIKDEEKLSDFWYRRGLHLSEIGEYEKAIECLDKELQLHEKNYNTFFLKGKILFQLQKYEESIECFNKASEINHSKYLKNMTKSEHLKKARKYENALIYRDESEKENPLNASFWYWKGLTFMQLKRFDMASKCFENSLEIKNDIVVLHNLAKSEFMKNNVNKSLELLKKISDLDPSYREKLRNDNDYLSLSANKQFRMILGL